MAPLRLHANLLFYGLDEGTWSDPPSQAPTPSGLAEEKGNLVGAFSSFDLQADPWADVPAFSGQDAWPANAESPTQQEQQSPQPQPVQQSQQQQSPGASGGVRGLETIKAVWSSAPHAFTGPDAASSLGLGNADAVFSGVDFSSDFFVGNAGSTAVNTAAIGGAGAVFATEPSTDEGSEPKGSESDSLPDSNEGYVMPIIKPQQRQALSGSHQPSAMLSHLPQQSATMCGVQATAQVTPVVPGTAGVVAPATSAYSPYNMPPGSFLAHPTPAGVSGSTAHAGLSSGFGSSEAGAFSYDAASSGFPAAASASAAGIALAAATPGGPPVDGVPSIGSYAHLSGQCSRCCFYPKGRCANGFSCQFCHFDHDKRPRNGKKKRYRRQADGTIVEGPDE